MDYVLFIRQRRSYFVKMREAIDNKESKKELDKLSSMVLQDYGVKVMINKKTGLLRAMSKDGKVISEETTD